MGTSQVSSHLNIPSVNLEPHYLTHRKPVWSDLLALVSGALLPLAYAPVSLFPLAILAPAVLFVLWHGAAPGRAAWRGFLFGLGQFGVGVGWLYIALHEYGGMHGLLVFPLLLMFIAFLAGYPALVGWLQARILTPNVPDWQGIWVLPALWVALEWMRGWFLTGFPWLDLGYSQIDSPLAGFAPWLGVYSVSFAAAASAALLALALRHGRRAWRYLVVLLLLWSGAWLAGQQSWVVPDGKPLRAALIQGNVSLAKKWSTNYRMEIVQRYAALTQEQHHVDLVVWPEAALPATLDELEEGYIPQLERLAASRHMDILLGILEQGYIDGGRTYYNSVLSIGAQPGVYRKHHLVPFGEYLPLQGLLRWLPNYLFIPMSDFSPGAAGQGSLRAAGRNVGISICYEDAFGREVRRALPQASFLVNVSEDAWYGDSWAPHQHQQMARMRALETGRPMLRATNTGITAIIDHRGVELARVPQFAVQVLKGEIQPMQGITPFVRFGNTPVMVFAVLILVVVIAWRRRRN